MRTSTVRAAKQASERFLTPGNPTGLAGLRTHPAPRPALINIYNQTLKTLKQFPKDSAYRASVEAITKHRLGLVEAVTPEGYDAWVSRVEKTHPELVKQARDEGHTLSIPPIERFEIDERIIEWDGTGLENEGKGEGPRQEDIQPYTRGERRRDARLAAAIKENDGFVKQAEEENKHLTNKAEFDAAVEKSLNRITQASDDARPPEPEPPLTAQQISDLENKFGAGLIEEVVEVADGELKLAAIMHENKVWEELVEKAPEGQWSYFERVRHVKQTQSPPQ